MVNSRPESSGWFDSGSSRRGEAGITAEASCPVCGSRSVVTAGHLDRKGAPLRTVACVGCGLFRVDPLPTPEELSRFHEEEYRQSYKGVSEPKLKHIYRAGGLAAARLDRLSPRMAPGAAVLDVGCSSGEWLYLLGKAGRRAQGIEANPSYAEFGRRTYGVTIQTGSIWEVNLPERSFDMLTMFHVLEHLPNPVEALARIERWVKEDGLLTVEVPNVNSPHQHPAKRFHYAHPIGFTPESLRRAAHLGGWQVVELTLDAHERNIFAVLKRGSGEAAWTEGHLPAPVVSSASSTLRYYLRVPTYLRFLARVGQFAREWLAVRAGRTPRELLDRFATR